MVLAQVRDTGVYQLLFILHIVSIVVAFAPAIVHTATGPRLTKEDEAASRSFFRVASGNSQRIYLPALLAVGLLGFALVGLSDDLIEFTDAWVLVSALLWLIIGGLVSAVMLPAERQMAEGDRTAESKINIAGGVVTLLFLVVVVLMVVKPG